MSFTNFTTGNGNSFGGKYLEIKTNELIRYTDKFDDPDLLGEMTVAVQLTKVSCGTDLHIVQEDIPEIIPVITTFDAETQNSVEMQKGG